MRHSAWLALLLLSFGLQAEPLPSWADSEARQRILDTVAAVTDPDGTSFVPPAERLAVFDNDGTLWLEKPREVQVEFVYWRIRELAPANPDWQNEQPFKAVLEEDYEYLEEGGFKSLRALGKEAQGGLTTTDYAAEVRKFLAQWRHPVTGTGYEGVVFQPVLDLARYLRDNDFQVLLVSAGGLDFMRVFAEELYGFAPDEVIGSTVDYRLDAEARELIRGGNYSSINAGPFKAVNIHRVAGRRPVIAVGNSDGDLGMFRYTVAGDDTRLAVLIVHDDNDRGIAYRDGADQVLELAAEPGWLAVSARQDFRVIYAPGTN